MKVGCLGDLVFEVSDTVIKTIRDASRSGSATIQTHQRHLMKPLPEFTGADADSFDFKIRFSAYLGADPNAELERLWSHMTNGVVLPLTIGTKSYGDWLIKKLKTTMEYYDRRGNLTSADVTVTLTEYIKD